MAISLQLFESIQSQDTAFMQQLWIYIAGPCGGGLLAAFFYRAIYKPLLNKSHKIEEVEEE
jgi:glycerol uptake facilitator-like aquaporin